MLLESWHNTRNYLPNYNSLKHFTVPSMQNIENQESSPYYAAVDLGSNSFHMLIARVGESSLEIVDRVKDMVQIARGLKQGNAIDADAQQRALDCLTRFSERLRDIPPSNIRAVGTKALRSAKNARSFLRSAEKALGCPIQIISGYEEARLVYAGLSSSVRNDHSQRLVIDIGGGSTEFVIGVDQDPLLLESLGMGCVTYTENYFSADKKITVKNMHNAYLAACRELEEIGHTYRHKGWQSAYGTSGTMKAIAELTSSTDGGAIITNESLEKLIEKTIKAGSIKSDSLPDLRKQVLPAGLAILQATFDQLKLKQIHVADSTLKEGLIYDTLGRFSDKDPRVAAIKHLASKHSVDQDQAKRVEHAAVAFWIQIEGPALPGISRTKILRWAAQLHEIGLSISHSGYHHHGFYILRHSDLAGFGRYEQYILSNLVRYHRRSLSSQQFEGMDEPAIMAFIPLLLCLRLAIVLHRRREDLQALPKLVQNGASYSLNFSEGWLANNPLTASTLDDEKRHFAQLGIALEFVS